MPLTPLHTGPASPYPEETVQLLKKFKNVNIYGLFLNPYLDHPLSKVLEAHGSEFNNLTGDKVMIAITGTPKVWSDNLKNYWHG